MLERIYNLLEITENESQRGNVYYMIKLLDYEVNEICTFFTNEKIYKKTIDLQKMDKVKAKLTIKNIKGVAGVNLQDIEVVA